MNIPTTPTPSQQSTPPKPHKKKLSPLYQIVLTKQQQAKYQHCDWTPEKLLYTCKLRSSKEPSLILRQPQKTKPMVWLAAILCMLFSLLVIFFGIATLIVYLSVQPRKPAFDTPSATLSGAYFTAPNFLNSEVIFLANFSNPNRKLNVRYDYAYAKLYSSESLIAAQEIQPFSLRPGTARIVSVVMVSRLLNVAPNLIVEFQKQVQRNRVLFSVKGSFRIRVKLGPIRYSYWIHEFCQLEMTNPPVSVLVAHSCTGN